MYSFIAEYLFRDLTNRRIHLAALILGIDIRSHNEASVHTDWESEVVTRLLLSILAITLETSMSPFPGQCSRYVEKAIAQVRSTPNGLILFRPKVAS